MTSDIKKPFRRALVITIPFQFNSLSSPGPLQIEVLIKRHGPDLLFPSYTILSSKASRNDRVLIKEEINMFRSFLLHFDEDRIVIKETQIYSRHYKNKYKWSAHSRLRSSFTTADPSFHSSKNRSTLEKTGINNYRSILTAGNDAALRRGPCKGFLKNYRPATN